MYLSNGDKLDLNNIDKPVVIIKSSISCVFCHQEVEALAKADLSSLGFSPLLLFTDNEDFEYLKGKNKLPKNFVCQYIKNGAEISHYFNMQSLPTTIVINNKNELVLCEIGFHGSVDNILSALTL